ncbi:non-hydrolyzing UDP-N-acetylglucosamine 2-epimerase [Anaeromyxobacter paludicola]|uniref:UDP-N-acetylglucosamine 2-epimerase (Non-hydrolyzing) n=1 Tax=Anaeromyxobacter paludicola TaxID=2918171 RepID=A0ABN6NCR3_9BACT|nr:UDP-N-acetylglucosamine 2-epimerase (non-hydrolyzing) [Anaeromyxobacter paludicola]BDG09914.1 UDP-N-acetylglucosamine 2-epimerase (non-hydrolyzing) [Anaeromyxobacter paludicola]
MPLVVHVVGTRPNFMKVAPVMRACAARGLEQRLVHTGQHYDARMSDVFFEDLGLPPPDLHLGVGSGSHAAMTARCMLAFEEALGRLPPPDWVVVPGDVNSTLAAALVAVKAGIRVAHLEAGLRSFDRTMPEELNRVATDHLADLLLTPSPDADRNLAREGIPAARVARVGNVMIDSLLASLPAARAREVPERLGLARGGYAVLTLHRPSNVDDPAVLARLLSALARVAARVPVVFPVHPRTRARLEVPGLAGLAGALRLVEPQGYLDFLSLTSGAALLLTDSGGLQEEATGLGVPCLTLRENTERPITVDEGTNTVVGTDPVAIVREAEAALDGRGKRGRRPELWDGRAAERVVDALLR